MLSLVNQQAADRVLTLLAKSPVAFIGAGMTAPRYKGWTGLIEDLAAQLHIAVDPSLGPLKQSQLFHDGAKDAYAAALTAIFRPIPDGCRDALKQLVSLDIAAFLTTNFDWSVFRALRENGVHPRVHVYPRILAADCTNKALFQVHGAIDDLIDLEYFVFHESAYLKAYSDPPLPRLSAFFYDVFGMKDVLFVGYGLGEDEPLRDVLEICRRVQIERGGDRERVMLRAIPTQPSDLASFEKEIKYYAAVYGIEVVRYERIDEAHAGLDAIIAEVQRLRPIARPRPTNSLAPMVSTTGR